MERVPKSDSAVARHPIAVVAERTGLSQDVLRVWERRYSAVQPQRDPGGQRLYSDADIERLTMLRAATLGGRSIGQIAHLDTAAVTALVDDDMRARERRGFPFEDREDGRRVIELALGYTSALDAGRLHELLRRTVVRLGVGPFVDSVAGPLLRRLGDEWAAGRITPAHEHFASTILHDLIADMMRSLAGQNGGRRLLAATLAGERHVIGAALVGVAAAVMGWHVIYLGADLPAADIAEAASRGNVHVVAVSIVYLDDQDRVLHEMRTLLQRLDKGMLVVAGGSGAQSLVPELSALGVRVESGFGSWLEELYSAEPAAPAAR